MLANIWLFDLTYDSCSMTIQMQMMAIILHPLFIRSVIFVVSKIELSAFKDAILK